MRQITKTYHSDGELRRGVRRMGLSGWQVQCVTRHRKRWGLIMWLFVITISLATFGLGLLLLLFLCRGEKIIVIYWR